MTSEFSGGSGPAPGGADDAWRPPVATTTATEHLDGYTDLVEIGRGGDSVVYRAREVAIGRDVAVKVLSIDTTSDPSRATRFAREIEITVQLGRQHPNIVTVLATGTTASGRPAVVMDFFEGGTLHDRLKAHGPMSPEEVGRVGEVMADALSFAHERGVLHRDVKPQNVLVLPTSWVLADFGIARLVDSEHTSSAETFTYRHAAPQILDGHAPTATDDIWSLGSTLFTLLDGRPPFASDDPDEDSALAYLRRARTEPHRPLVVPGAERLTAVINRCLVKDVAGRWATAAELRDALHGVRASSAWDPVAPAPAPGPATAPPRPTLAKAPPPPPDPTSHTPTPTPTPTPTVVPPNSFAPLSHSPVAPRPDALGPVPLAISAVSHSVHAVDAAPTGTGMIDPTGRGPDKPPPAPTEEDERPPRRRLPLILGAAALAIGLTIGVVATQLRKDDPEPTQSAGTVPSGTSGPQQAQAVPDTFTLDGRRPDPQLRVTLIDLRLDSRNLEASWTDPTEGEGEFTIMATTPARPEGFPVTYSPPGTGQPQAVFELLSPLEFGRTCFYVIVRDPAGQWGVSDRTRRCGVIDAFGLELPHVTPR